MAKHRASRPYPLGWELKYIRNQWFWFWKPRIKKGARNAFARIRAILANGARG